MTQRFDLNTITPTPWKNGGGTTREVARHPPDAAMDAFEWRVSVAEVNTDGAFSSFPQIDRSIALLAGRGMMLNELALTEIGVPYSFAGEKRVYARLIAGASLDFNVMVRRGAWRADLTCLDTIFTTPSAPAVVIVYVVRGQWRAGDDKPLASGQGYVHDAPGQLTMSPISNDALALLATLIRV